MNNSKKKLPVSLIVTVFNEEKTIKLLLESIENQTHIPSEVIFVDAESSDNTKNIIKDHADKSGIVFKILTKKLNRSAARNYGITKAMNQIIAITDAGNILDELWLEKISKPLLSEEAESVAGFYSTEANSDLQKAMVPFVAVLPQNIDNEAYLPSSRSIAFTKTAWDKAGNYPEHLEYCEDLVFAKNLKEKTKMLVVKDALVTWIVDKNLPQFFTQISNYAKGDILANYTPHVNKILTQYLRYGVFFIFPPLFFIYLLWPIHKFSNEFKNSTSLIYLPVLQITSDLAILFGATKGFLKKLGYI